MNLDASSMESMCQGIVSHIIYFPLISLELTHELSVHKSLRECVLEVVNYLVLSFTVIHPHSSELDQHIIITLYFWSEVSLCYV